MITVQIGEVEGNMLKNGMKIGSDWPVRYTVYFYSMNLLVSSNYHSGGGFHNIDPYMRAHYSPTHKSFVCYPPFELQMLQTCKIIKNVLQKRKMKVARNRRGKVRTSPQRPQGLPKRLPDRFRGIHGRHQWCRWRWIWANQRHFSSNVEMHRDWSKMTIKSGKWKLREMVGRRSEQVRNVPTGSLKAFRTNFRRYMTAISDAGGGEIGCILVEIWRCIEIDQKWPPKAENKSCDIQSQEGQDKSAKSPRTS